MLIAFTNSLICFSHLDSNSSLSFTVNTIASDVSEPVFRASSSNSVPNSVNRVNDASVVNTVYNSSISFATWHSRLGHPTVDCIQTL